MSEEMELKIKQVKEILSIYETTIKDESMVENIGLIRNDLENKRKELEKIIGQLYEAGFNEIDTEINQVQNEIQNIDNLISVTNSYQEKKEIPKEMEDRFESNLEKIAGEVEPILKEIIAPKDESIEKDQKQDELQEAEKDEEIEENELEKQKQIDQVYENAKEEIVEEIENEDDLDIQEEENLADIFAVIEEEDVGDKEENIAEIENKSKIIAYEESIPEDKTDQSLEVASNVIDDSLEKNSFLTIKLKVPDDNYKVMTKEIVNDRARQLFQPQTAVLRSDEASTALMDQIKKVLLSEDAK